MSNWEVREVTNWGCSYFAESSTSNPVRATGGAVSNKYIDVDQARAVTTRHQIPGAIDDVTSRILSLSVTGSTLRVVVLFRSTKSMMLSCKSVALLSGENVIAILSSSISMFYIPAASESVVGVSVDFEITFTNTGQATVDVSDAKRP